MFPLLYSLLLAIGVSSCEKDTTYKVPFTPGNGGYIFAHMTDANYGSLFYSVSRDGLSWENLNEGAKINNEYRGHPDLSIGREGQYYMIGVDATTAKPVLWRSNNLIGWAIEKELPDTAFDLSAQGYFTETLWYGAPKMYYDEPSDQYLITWHAASTAYPTGDDMWRSMRTFYMLTSDFETFSAPQRLFHFTGTDENMATIDAIIRQIDGTYYAIMKDERWPTDIATGKTVRVAQSASLTTGYSNPGPSITPAWHEAPTLVHQPNSSSWFLYAEQYPNNYALFAANSISGPWVQQTYDAPAIRHGSVIWVDEATYQAVYTAYYQNASSRR